MTGWWIMQCRACLRPWLDKPGALGKHFATGCPDCGHVYWTCTAVP